MPESYYPPSDEDEDAQRWEGKLHDPQYAMIRFITDELDDPKPEVVE